MRNVSPLSSGALVWATVLACCLQATLAVLAVDSELPKSQDDNLQVEPDMIKRDWNNQLRMWGKRGWGNLRGGWGVKRAQPSWTDEDSFLPVATQKRSWKKLQNGWGKRSVPDDELAINQLASMLEQDQMEPPFTPQYAQFAAEDELEPNDDGKRSWGQFNNGWGKRSKWEKFRGSWGKRDPAWSNLKGIWGKRSIDQN